MPENFCVFLSNSQKAERRRPNGTGLVRPCPQGLFSPFFTFLRAIFFRPFRLSLAPTICPWVPEDDLKTTPLLNKCKGKGGRGRTKNSSPFSSPYYWSQYTLEKEKEHKPRSAISSPVLFGRNIWVVVASGAVSLKSMTLAFLTVRS